MEKRKIFYFIPVFSLFLTGCDLASVMDNAKELGGKIVDPIKDLINPDEEGGQKEEEKHAHVYVEHTAKAATCETAGNIAYYTCEGCDKYFDSNKVEITQAQTVVAKTGHKLTHHVAVEGSDCQHKGTVEYWDCSSCNKKFSDKDGTVEITTIEGNYGAHIFVDHNPVSATCTEKGSQGYAECSLCNEFFALDHETQIAENSWVISELGHDYEIQVSGTFKTNYITGDTFDKTGLVVKKVCKNDSTHVVVLEETEYGIVYQNGSAISTGDTKVTIVVDDELTKDIAISVDKKANTIVNLEESYEGHCHEGIDLTDVSATSGEVSAKYYSDTECTQEVAAEDLVGGNTYYVVVTSDGVDTDYQVAQATTTLTVSHSYENDNELSKIGYKNNKCSYCGDVVTTETKMTSSDVILTSQDEYGIPNAYGLNADAFSIDKTEGVSVLGMPLWVNDTESTVSKNVVFPKVDYSLFENVIFILESNADTWGGGYIGLKLNGEDLITEADHGEAMHGIIKAEYHSENDGYIEVSAVLSDGYTKTIVVDDPDILDGTEGLTFAGSFGKYRGMSLVNMLLDHTTHEGIGDGVVSKTTIGHYEQLCVCGEIAGHTNELMTTEDIYIPNTYKAGFEVVDGNTPRFVVNEDQSVLWDGNNSTIKMNMPQVEFSAYKEVKFSMYYMCLWGQIGFAQENTFGGYGDGSKTAAITLDVMQMADGSFKATLSCPSEGAMLTSTITDTDVLAGTKPLGLYLTFSGYTCIHLDAIEVSADYAHEHEYKFIATDVIGTSKLSNVCGICGLEKTDTGETRVSQKEDVDYSKSLYGATQFCGNSYEFDETSSISSGSEFGGCIKYVPTSDHYAQRKQTLPKIDYSKYVQVEFQIHAKAYYGFSLVGGWEKGEFIHGTEFNGKLVVDVVGENKLNLTLLKSDGTLVNTKTLEGAEGTSVYTGATGITIYGLIAEGGDFVSVSRPTFNAEHQHINTAVSNPNMIGNKLNSCVGCGETVGLSSEVMQNKDIDFMGTNGYGLSHEKMVNQGEYFEIGGDTLTSDLLLPKVNYSLYDEVVFDFTIVTLWGKLGYGDATIGNIGDGKRPGGDVCYVIISKVSEGSYKFSIIDVDKNKSAEASITDSDIISGTKQLNMKCELGAYTALRVNGVSVSTNGHVHIPTVVADTNVIGYKKSVCPICGETLGSSTEIMTTSDINLGNGYGISFSSIIKNSDNTYTFDGSNNENTELLMPKVNYSLYSEVKFTFKVLTLWGQIGYGDAKIGGFGDGTTGEEIVATISKQSDSSYKFIISDESRSLSAECVLSDADVLSGKKSLDMYLNLAAYSSLILMSADVTVAK